MENNALVYSLKTAAEKTEQNRYGKELKGWAKHMGPKGQAKRLTEIPDNEGKETTGK